MLNSFYEQALLALVGVLIKDPTVYVLPLKWNIATCMTGNQCDQLSDLSPLALRIPTWRVPFLLLKNFTNLCNTMELYSIFFHEQALLAHLEGVLLIYQ